MQKERNDLKYPSADQIIAELEKEIQLNATLDKYFIPVVLIGCVLIFVLAWIFG